jgi:hypothetical protein
MREKITELEFQFALMMGYYSIEGSVDDLGFFLPTQFEENKELASDWFIENCRGINLYLQFKASKPASDSRLSERRDLFGSAENQDEVFEIELRKRNDFQQHKMLYDLDHGDNSSLGFYVAPVFSSKIELINKLRIWISRMGGADLYAYTLLNENSEIINLSDLTPDVFSFFDDVIYIRPHATISDNISHHYCYNTRREVSFHSKPTRVPERGFSFPEVVQQVRSLMRDGKGATLSSGMSDLTLNYMKNAPYYNYYSFLESDELQSRNTVDYNAGIGIGVYLHHLLKERKYQEYLNIQDALLNEHFGISRIFIYDKKQLKEELR